MIDLSGPISGLENDESERPLAQRLEMKLVDDLDGSEAKETVSFGISGRFYKIDLSEANAKEFRGLLRPYMVKSRAVAPPHPKTEAPKIRAWARENGYEIASRGRVSKEIIEAYRRAEG